MKERKKSKIDVYVKMLESLEFTVLKEQIVFESF